MNITAIPADGVISVTKSDSADLPKVVRGIYIGGAGNIALVALDGTTATFNGLQAGTILPVAVRRVLATGTTATGLVGLV